MTLIVLHRSVRVCPEGVPYVLDSDRQMLAACQLCFGCTDLLRALLAKYYVSARCSKCYLWRWRLELCFSSGITGSCPGISNHASLNAWQDTGFVDPEMCPCSGVKQDMQHFCCHLKINMLEWLFWPRPVIACARVWVCVCVYVCVCWCVCLSVCLFW